MFHNNYIPKKDKNLYKYNYVFAFLVKKTSGILIFGPSFRKPARKVSSGEIYLKKQVFICYRPVNMIQQN